MQKAILAVRDRKTALFDQPFAIRHVNEAIREFTIIAKNKDTKWGKNPEDFELVQIGTFDDETGTLGNCSPHLTLCEGISL